MQCRFALPSVSVVRTKGTQSAIYLWEKYHAIEPYWNFWPGRFGLGLTLTFQEIANPKQAPQLAAASARVTQD
jgi:hypothetical protein